MDTPVSTDRSVVAGLATALLALVLLLPACSDDPILGPDDGKKDDSGGSYSNIKRLAPADSAAPGPQTTNPERF